MNKIDTDDKGCEENNDTKTNNRKQHEQNSIRCMHNENHFTNSCDTLRSSIHSTKQRRSGTYNHMNSNEQMNEENETHNTQKQTNEI